MKYLVCIIFALTVLLVGCKQKDNCPHDGECPMEQASVQQTE